ncbi:MAG: hypothetical protein ACK5EM_04055 [Burkholderiales bacterium]
MGCGSHSGGWGFAAGVGLWLKFEIVGRTRLKSSCRE